MTQGLRKFVRIGTVPTVLRFDGLRIVIYPNDRRPAHVHAIGRGYEAVFNRNCPAGPAEFRENYGFSRREIGHTGAVLMDHPEKLCRAWEQIHDVA